MLTIFGKKKKDEETGPSGQAPTASSPTPPTISLKSTQPSQFSANQPSMPASTGSTSPNPPLSQAPPQSFSRPTPTVQQPVFRASPNAPLPVEETSLTKLLQSLLADIPLPPGMDSDFTGANQTTPDYVPVRSTPVSRPMVIGQGKESGTWEESDEAPSKPSISSPSKPSKPFEPQPAPSKTVPTSPAQPVPISPTTTVRKDQTPEKPPDKVSKIEKQPEPPAAPAKPAKAPRPTQGFDHIFQLTQGNLETSGLVIINGGAGSGRTTLCSGLTANYMKMGNPCLYLTCDQAPSALRDQMKKIGTDAAQYESSYRFIIVDGFAVQSESFSMEMYYVDQPFNFDNITEALVRNMGMFVGEKVRVILDSLDTLATKIPGKDFVKGVSDLTNKLKDSGATVIVTIDTSKLPKDVAGPLNDLADCAVDLSKDDSDPNGRELKVQRLNHSSAKVDAETFEIDASKGLVFV